MSFSIAVEGDTNDPKGISGRLVPPMVPIVSVCPTVRAEGKAVLTMTATIPAHGNPRNPKAPGFNPPCAHATIVSNCIPNILVEGKPLAVAGPPGVGSLLSCGHVVLGPGVSTIRVGR